MLHTPMAMSDTVANVEMIRFTGDDMRIGAVVVNVNPLYTPREIGVFSRREIDRLGEINGRRAERIDDRQQRGQRKQHRFDELAEIFGNHDCRYWMKGGRPRFWHNDVTSRNA